MKHEGNDPGMADTRWDLYAAAVVFLFAFFQCMLWPTLPRFVDVYYHLSVMQGFAHAGGYVTHAFWEYAPEGRPHLYAPAYHFLLLAIGRVIDDPIVVGRFMECVLYPVFLLVLWRAWRSLYGASRAFFGLLAVSSVFSIYLAVGILGPFSLAMLCAWVAFERLERGRPLASCVFLVLGLYTHMMMGLMGVAAIALYASATPGRRRHAFSAVAVALVVALPLMMQTARYASHVQYAPVREHSLLELDPMLFALALGGLWIAFRERGRSLFPLCLLVVMLPMLKTHQARFLSQHGLVGCACLAAFALAFLYERYANRPRASACFLGGSVLLFYFLAPVVHLDTRDHRVSVRVLDRSISHYAPGGSYVLRREAEEKIYFPDLWKDIIDTVEQNTGPDDIIWCDYNYGGGVIALVADRVTSSVMVSEIQPLREIDPYASARVLIWFKSLKEDVRSRMEPVVRQYDLQLLAETGLAYVYLNPAGGEKVRIARPTVPTMGVAFAAAVILALLFLDRWQFNRGRRHNIAHE